MSAPNNLGEVLFGPDFNEKLQKLKDDLANVKQAWQNFQQTINSDEFKENVAKCQTLLSEKPVEDDEDLAAIREEVELLKKSNLGPNEVLRYVFRKFSQARYASYRVDVLQNPENATEADKQVVELMTRIAPDSYRDHYIKIAEIIGQPRQPLLRHPEIPEELYTALERAGVHLPRPKNPYTEIQRALVQCEPETNANHPINRFIAATERVSAR